MKTILFSVSSGYTFRNLFFFPRSVFAQLAERLKERPDLRIVLVVAGKARATYLPYIKDSLGERLILQSVPDKDDKSFLGKLFYFCYSYLCYTGTTRVIATMGMRVGEPPAGGIFRRYVAPVKWLIAHTLGRSRFVRERLVPFWYHRFFTNRPFERLFTSYEPDLVFLPNLFSRFDMDFLAAAKRNGVVTMGMAASWDHFDKYYLPFKVDALLAQSEQIKDFAVRFQWYDPKCITLVGYPHFDFIASDRHLLSRQELFERLGFPQGSKFILYISGSAYCADEPDIIAELLRWADEGKFGMDVRLVIRPYAGARSSDRDFDEQKFNSFESHPRVRFYRREAWGDLADSVYYINLMRHADAIVAIYTTAILEAAALDRPLIGIDFDGHHQRPFRRSVRRFRLREHFKTLFETRGVHMAQDFDDLLSTLKDYLHDPRKDAAEREALRKIACFRIDGRASERIVTALLDRH
ncbi:MAG: hypothetical protein Q8R13_04495 [bacterium]|nr:hypothetical protein [bacterium]MDZ4296052.1 hypothetical protein [Patescibacteria group bacterium]